MQSPRSSLSSTLVPIRSLFVGDAAGGVVLILVAIAAIAIANSPLAHAYHALFHERLSWSPVPRLENLHLWVNDGLMAIFFLVVGLEVKREIMVGQLSSAAGRRLPVLAALAGMAMPAAVYWLAAGGDPQLARGWAIPAATDIAFAMGVVGLLGSRVPGSLRLFLLTVAIVDDIGAVFIIALFYSSGIALDWIVAALVILTAMLAANRLGVTRAWVYALLAVMLWYAVLHSGVHATIAGVAGALAIPMRGPSGATVLERMEHALTDWNAYLIVPLFAFANAGVALEGIGLGGLFAPLPLAVAAGLVAGKQTGIFISVWLAHHLGFAARPAGASWLQVWGVAMLCGIGFTMSLFIGALAFPGYPVLAEEAKLGVLTGSLVSALLGYAVLRIAAAGKQG